MGGRTRKVGGRAQAGLWGGVEAEHPARGAGSPAVAATVTPSGRRRQAVHVHALVQRGAAPPLCRQRGKVVGSAAPQRHVESVMVARHIPHALQWHPGGAQVEQQAGVGLPLDLLLQALAAGGLRRAGSEAGRGRRAVGWWCGQGATPGNATESCICPLRTTTTAPKKNVADVAAADDPNQAHTQAGKKAPWSR